MGFAAGNHREAQTSRRLRGAVQTLTGSAMSPLRTAATALTLVTSMSVVSTGANADAARGKALVQRECTSCHAVEPGGKSPNPKAPTFSAITNEPSATPYSLRVFLQTTHNTMPNFIIEPDDIDDIVSYIVSLKQKP